MNSKKLLATIAISTILLTGCGFKDGETIVKVNGENITQGEFDKAFNASMDNSIFANMGVDVKNDKSNFLYLMMKDKVVNELIVRKLLDEEIAKRHIQVTNDDINKEFKNIVDKIGSREKFDEILKQNNISFGKFKKDLKEEVKMRKLVSEIAPIKISDADAQKFYKENISKFRYPDKVRASHILIAANPEEIKQKIIAEDKSKKLSEEEIKALVDKELATKLEKAKKILAEVKKDPSAFDRIARENSEDPKSAKQGGDLGFFAKNEMVEPFAKTAFKQKPNSISEIVQTPYGYHIILVKDRMKAGQEPYEKVKSDIKFYLENQANIKVMESLVEKLKREAKIEYVNPEYNPSNIQQLLQKEAKNNPTAKEEIQPEAQSATPKPHADKIK